MCEACDYEALLTASGIGHTPGRMQILEMIGNSPRPMSANEVYEKASARRRINRVTVYRILDLLVQGGLLSRISGGGRSFFYGMAPNENHRPHHHIYCHACGNMRCLAPESLPVDMQPLAGSVAGRIENVEIRVDGVCRSCLREERRSS